MNTKNSPVITIDGPSGSGKGTVSLIIAARLGWNILDSGAIYRILALAAIRSGIEPTDTQKLEKRAVSLDIEFIPDIKNRVIKTVLDGNDVSDQIRDEECGKWASQIATLSSVRTALLERQRSFLKSPGLVADGRDMGTTVFPNAECKIFLSANNEERAKRRYKQLKEKGINVNFSQVLDDINERDKRDRNRSVSPLEPDKNAVIIDTTDLNVDDVAEHVINVCKDRIKSIS